MVAIFEEPFALTHTTLFYCCHQSLSQLYISNENWSPAIILPRFWNLRRLHMLYHDRENIYPRLLAYSGPVLYKLEILELSFAVESMFDHLTHLLLFCPNLKSLFLQIEGGHYNLDDLSSNRRFFETVENLIIEISKSWVSHCKLDDWVCFMELVRMFPNLKNLGLRNVHNLTEDLIVAALQWSFNLKLLDIKVKTTPSSGNDSFSSGPSIKAENIASCFFWRHRQRITCIVRPYEDDYESVSVQTGTWHIKEGFDFMTHVFPRNFSFSPVFLVDYNPCED
uniref:F-box domain-containing protein n=2 Tax=Tetranychus urticae TaxID=32264 RepID=T1KC25_TETUR